jgi:general secretion pathway protein G
MRRNGFTIAELVVVVAIIGLLATLVLPVARFGIKRQKEIELRDRIRKITGAIDQYHYYKTKNLLKDPGDVTQGEYPKELEVLVEGFELVDGRKIKLLRERDLVDPMTGLKEWDTRSSTDEADSSFSDENNVFDVRSKSSAMSLDGKTRYNEW